VISNNLTNSRFLSFARLKLKILLEGVELNFTRTNDLLIKHTFYFLPIFLDVFIIIIIIIINGCFEFSKSNLTCVCLIYPSLFNISFLVM